jgi:hypothetical protein
VLSGWSSGVAHIALGADEVEIAFEDIEKANTVYAFSSADFQGSDASPSGKNSGRAARGRRND